MLNERDHRMLVELERRLRAEDPGFVELFGGRGGSRCTGATAATRCSAHSAFTVSIVIAVLVAVLFILLGEPGTAVLCGVAAGALAVLRIRFGARRKP